MLVISFDTIFVNRLRTPRTTPTPTTVDGKKRLLNSRGEASATKTSVPAIELVQQSGLSGNSYVVVEEGQELRVLLQRYGQVHGDCVLKFVDRGEER